MAEPVSVPDIVRVVRGKDYRPCQYNEPPDMICPICEKTLYDSVNVIVKDRNKKEFEIHSRCLPKRLAPNEDSYKPRRMR